jgi:hypothetical protein
MVVPSLSLPVPAGARGVVVRRAALEPEVLPADAEPAAVALALPAFAAAPTPVDGYAGAAPERLGGLLDLYC